MSLRVASFGGTLLRVAISDERVRQMAVRLEVNVSSRGAAVTDSPNYAVADMLDKIAARIREGSLSESGPIRDDNGAMAGSFVFDAQDPED